MPIRNQNWYDLQASRRYPLDERSTGEDDAGAAIRESILVDCHIRFPSTLGQYLYVQGMTVAPGLVTLVFGVSEDLESAGTTVAAVSLPRTAPQNVNHAVTALQPGVAGWVVLGPGLAEEFAGRYSTPRQTLIAQRCARPYRPLPVPSIGKLNLATSLQDIVTLAAQAPVTATLETVQVNGAPKQAIVLRLEGETDTFNPLKEYSGVCGQRPESGTCPKPPIEAINGVTPDCNGNINLEFEGLTPYLFTDCGGVDVNTERGLAEACAGGQDARRAVQDNCRPGVEGLEDIPWDDPTPEIVPDIIEEEDIGEDGITESCRSLPVYVTFTDGTAADFVVRSGTFAFPTTTLPDTTEGTVYAGVNAAAVSVALFKNCASDWALNKVFTTEFKIEPTGLKLNGGLVLNYLQGDASLGIPTTYLIARINANRGKLQLMRYSGSGSGLINEHEADFQATVGRWYQLTAVPAFSGTLVNVTVTCSASDGSVPTVSFVVPIPLADYGASLTGQVGLYAQRSVTYFNSFTIHT